MPAEGKSLSNGLADCLSASMPEYNNVEVAISGMSGRLPESANIEEFKEHLMNNEDMVTEDDRRWEVGFQGLPPRNGKLKDVERFDAAFFSVHAKQSLSMDPQLKILLECTYEAIIDAGKSLQEVKGSRTGVFVGVSTADCGDTWTEDFENINGYAIVGSAKNMFANRLSFFFDFRGPSVIVDTACSSSAYCLTQALCFMRMGVIDSAIVAGSNLLMKAALSLQFLTLGVLSPDGSCKAFDASANGYCRSESIMAIYLQKVPDCKRIYATLVHSKSNSDGYKEEGVTFPSGIQQQNLIKEVYHECGINPLDVSYVEAHGTGTHVGDPQEVNSIAGFFCKGRKEPLLIGSVKSNMGHAEACSGLNAIAKIIIAMENQMIPANIHFKNPNPGIQGLIDGSLKVVDENTRWKGGLVAMNSFGFGGSNVHCLFKSHQKELKEPHPASQKPRLFTYGGRTEEGVQAVLEEAKKNSQSVEFQALMESSANMPIKMLPYRGYTVLNAYSGLEGIQKNGHQPRPIWFVFDGMGTQWHGMGRKMMELEVFRSSILKSTKYLKRYGVDLYDLIMNGHETTFDETVPSFIGITAIQVALVDLLFAMGIKPDGIIGHSVGELGCAYADGSLTAEEAVLAAYNRGRCIAEATLPAGKMAAVGLSWDECKELCPPGVVPACHNSVDTVTISGPYEETTKFVESLKAQGIFTRDVKCNNVAFHSYYMKEIAPQLKAALDQIIKPKKRSSKWVSTSVPEARWHEEMAQYSSSDYHVNNLVSAVLFQEGLQKIPSNAVAIEIAPHNLLQAILKRSLSTESVIVGCMKRFHENNVEFFFDAIGKCYANSVDVNPLSVYPPVEFPVPRGTPMISSCISKSWDHSALWEIPKHAEFNLSHGGASRDCVFNIDISEESVDHYLSGHKIDGRVLFPATGYMVLAWKALAKLKGQLYEKMPVIFQNLHIQRATVLPATGTVTLSVSIMPSTGEFEICQNDSQAASGVIFSPEGEFLDRNKYSVIGEMEKQGETTFQLTKEEVYKELRLKGYEYASVFQGILKASNKGEAAELIWDGKWIPFIDTMLQQQVLSTHEQVLRLPTRIKSVKIDPKYQPLAPVEGEPIKTLRSIADTVLNISICGGVEIQGLDISIAPRRAMHNSPTIEEHCFVPFTANMPEVLDSSLKEYCKVCLNFAMNSLNTLVTSDKDNNLPNKDLLNMVIQNNKPSTEIDISKLKSFPNSGFIQTLEDLFSLPLSKEFCENAQNLIASQQPQLISDMLLSCLDHTRVLKPALDLVLENILSKKISVFEVGANQSGLYSQVIPLLESQPLVKVQYTAADKSPLDKSCNNFDVTTSRWDLGTASSPPHGQSHLVILKNVLHKQKDIDKAFQLISSMVLPNGFVLVEEVTDNFPLHLVLEALTQKLDASSDNKQRICGSYLSQESWENMFASHGYEIVYKKSDQLLSTLFLLRCRQHIETMPSLLPIDDLECSWVDELKSKINILESAPKETRLWLVATNEINGIMGLVSCLRLEAGGDKVRFVFVSNLRSSSSHPDLNVKSKEFRTLMEKDLVMNVYRDGHWGTFKHVPISTEHHLREKPCAHAYVNVLTRGDLSSLIWIESPLKNFTQNGHNKTLCSVYYASLNFRDIMLASGKLPPDSLHPDVATKECILGMEFAGRNAKGQRLMGIMACQALASSVAIDSKHTWKIPDHWSMEQAATVPVVYATVYYALVVRGNIKKGERVLIHSGSGGVGQAAIAVALSYGCEVFTTVGSQEKKEFLKRTFPQLKDRNFSSSRDLSFEFDILKETNGKGVNIVLNSLAEEKLQSSVRLLARHGRFLEIGKFDLSKNSSLGMSIFLRNISFHGVLLDALMGETDSEEWTEVYHQMQVGIDSGVVRPLRVTIFDKEELEPAFRFMAQGKHIGKVVIKIRNEEPKKISPASVISIPAVARTTCDPCKTYVITGGLGGFGLELAGWLVERGAMKLVLTSRSGVKTGYQKRKILTWKSMGVQLIISKHNCSSLVEAKLLLEEAGKLGLVGGVFNLAMVLRDDLFENQTVELFKEVAEPKVKGTINLDKATRELCKNSLDWFVVFSSVSCGRGNMGQTNYGFANSVMERICEKRKAENLHGLAIQWGAIGDVGVIAESMGGNDTVIGGSLPQKMFSCLNVLDQILNQPYTIVSSFVKAEVDRRKEGSTKKQKLVDIVANILGMKDASKIDGDLGLGDLGLDSLMGVEIKQLLERDYELSLSSKEIHLLTFNKLHSINGAESENEGNVESCKGEDTAESIPLISSAMTRFDCKQVLPKMTIIHLNNVQNGLKPMFVVHPIEGNIESLRELTSNLPCPVYGIQLTAEAPVTSIQALAGFYLQNVHSVDPVGPYRLAGYSLGCILALEMASQLRKHYPDRGDIVQSLTLLDGSLKFVEMFTNAYKKAFTLKSLVEEQAGCMIGFLKQFVALKDDLAIFQNLCQTEDLKKQIEATVDIVMMTKVFPCREDLEKLALLHYRILRAAEKYQPSHYSGDVTLVKAKQNVFHSSDPIEHDYNLHAVCDGKINVIEVEGDHESFLIEEGAKRVAKIMIPILSR